MRRSASRPPSTAPASPRRSGVSPGTRDGEFISTPRARLILVAITACAAFLRLYHFGQSPPGLNQDEAVNAWNAWCLLKTGHDMTGASWPVFYSHAIGDNRTTLYSYALLPFQAIGGLGVWTTRLPNAVAGIACVPLLYGVGARLFGRGTGLIAALLLALDPWALFMSRWGIEGGLCPLLALGTLALLLAAGLPFDEIPRAPRVALAALAGLFAGLACYGYWCMRLYVPALLALLALAIGRAGWARLARGRGLAALAAFASGLCVTLGPLAWKHLVDPAIGRRAAMTRLWDPGTPLAEIARRVAGRYFAHFGPDFLFVRGDRYELVSPIGQGEFSWYMLPVMIAGLAFAFARARRSRAARVLLATVIAYPAGDVISRYPSVHAMRSAPGIPALVLLAAFGAAAAGAWLWARRRPIAVAAAIAFGVAIAALDGRFLVRYFGEYNARPEIYHGYHADLIDATRWLGPRLGAYDAVFCTAIGMNEPFAVTLVGLSWDPRRWFAEPRDTRVVGDWDVTLRYGKMRFMHERLWVPDYERLANDGRPERALFIVRPGELGLEKPVHVIRGPDGRDALWLCEESI